MKKLLLCCCLSVSLFVSTSTLYAAPVPFVVQLTRSEEVNGQRRVMLQLDRVMKDLGPQRIKLVVVAYEEGIQALLTENLQTSQLVTKLANAGVEFRVCRISMKAWGYTEEDFPMDVEFIPAGATELLRLQTEGYRYWRP